MKFIALLASLACLLSAPLVANAQVWRNAGSAVNGDTYELDVSSLRHAGPLVTSWYKRPLIQDQTVSGTLFKHFHSELVQRVDNCSNGTVAVAASNMLDASGKIVSSYVLSLAQLQFVSVAPGSTNQVMQRWICGEIARRNGLVAALQVSPTSKTQWKAFGTDVVNGVQWFFVPDSIKSTGNITSAIVESVSNTFSSVPNGPPYKYLYALDAIDCDHRGIEIVASDAYEEGGDLVDTYQAASNATAAPSKIVPGTIGDMLISQDCAQQVASSATPAIPAQTPAASISTGTAWLGPKGYLITADHVIEGASEIALMQDGNIVGTADVVITDPANDIAILRPHLKGSLHAMIALRTEPARLGERAITLGYPDPQALGLSIKLTSGEISTTTARSPMSSSDPRWMQISVPIQPGNSGGPLLDADGRAIGIVLARQMKLSDADVSPENVNYAVKISYVASILDGLPDIGRYRQMETSKNALDAIERLQGSVFLIAASVPAQGQ